MKIPALYYYYSALVGYFGLFGLLMLWITVLSPVHTLPTALLLIICITPLLLPLRGFLHVRAKSCAWMAYISMPYFIHGVSEAYASSTEQLYGGLEILFSLLLFLGNNLYLRAKRAKK